MPAILALHPGWINPLRYGPGSLGGLLHLRAKWFAAMVFFLIIGLSDSIYLTYHHYQINILHPQTKSFCTLNETIDCDKVAVSIGSTLMDVPVATWGMFAFLFLMLFIMVERLLYFEIQKALYCFVFLIIYLMTLFSLYEAFISFFVLNAVCIMCAAIYLDVVLMLVSCKRALGISHREFMLLLRDLFFRSFTRTLLRKGVSVAIIAIVFSGIIAFALDYKFQKLFSYQRVDILLMEQ
jgi:uncharacterized membrane protein